MNQNRIPIVVGVTGHRDIRPEDISALEKAVTDTLLRLQKKYPSSPVLMLNSLASGADTLCARVAQSLNIPLYCPLPMEKAEYRKDFSADEATEFDRYCSLAEQVFTAPPTEPYLSGRDYLYRQAGIYVATHCHILLALWDGTPAKPTGCGTAEAVSFMLNGSYVKNSMFQADNEGAVIHISTPRLSGQTAFPVTVTLLETQPGSSEKQLSQTDRFNRQSAKLKKCKAHPLVSRNCMEFQVAKKLHGVYDYADALSVKHQERYMTVLRLFATFSVLLVMLYLLYDEAEWIAGLICYGVIAAVYGLCSMIIDRCKPHSDYLQLRALAETVRVQLYFSLLGIPESVCDDFTWTQKQDAVWIRKAVNALLIGESRVQPVDEQMIKKEWIDGQKAYHTKACLRDAKKNKKLQHLTRAMILCTLITWAGVFLLEYFFRPVMLSAFWGLTVRTWLKIVWGSLSAVTVFVSGYYGKLSLNRKSIDHQKMVLLFTKAARQFEENPTARTRLFRQLGREELIENGNWVSYCQENTPDFNLS